MRTEPSTEVTSLASDNCAVQHPIHFAALQWPCRLCVEAAAYAVDIAQQARDDIGLTAVAEAAGVMRPRHRDDSRPVSVVSKRLDNVLPFRLTQSRKGC